MSVFHVRFSVCMSILLTQNSQPSPIAKCKFTTRNIQSINGSI